MSDGALKIRLQAVPEDGEANRELLTFLEKEIGSKWEIMAGLTSTRKEVN